MDAQKLADAIATVREALIEHAGNPHRFAMVTITSMTENVLLKRGPVLGIGDPETRMSAADFAALFHVVTQQRALRSPLQDTVRVNRFTY